MVRSAGRAVTIGCGLGDDAEALAAAGYQVTAFDISETAIEWCSRRFPNSRVEYKTLDLFALPEEWPGHFDLVFESNTIQALMGEYRHQALEAIARLVAPGGVVLVSCRSRNEGEKEDAFPIPLTRGDLDRFIGSGLVEDGFDAYDDDQDPPVPHYFSWYSRPRSI
jgi:2-polyprenyl-3-methyl-5-hydroxy-6-metoxy-1,4-benzoquinol methylase